MSRSRKLTRREFEKQAGSALTGSVLLVSSIARGELVTPGLTPPQKRLDSPSLLLRATQGRGQTW